MSHIFINAELFMNRFITLVQLLSQQHYQNSEFMIRYALFILLLLIYIPAQSQNPGNDQKEFLENLKTLCGNSYSGVVVHPETPPRGFTDPLVAHFTVCEDNVVHIPFHVGENTSRIWMLTMSDEGLLFKHDHRHPDGTPENMTDYGGWANEEGTPLIQRFPADEYTISLRESLKSHIWVIELSEDLSTYSYSLYLYENLYFRADFDLVNPISN
jgi:hypothetical protein